MKVLTVAWRISRSEIILLGSAAVLVSVVSLALATLLEQLTPSCLRSTAVSVSDCVGQQGFFDVARLVGGLIVGFAGLPPAIGALLGVQLVAREIEQGTAPFSWAIARSRRRWLGERTVALGFAVVLMLIPMAIVGHVLTGASDPGADAASSLDGFGFRGPTLVMRGVVMFAIGILVGAITGRVLPALLISAVPAVLLIGLGTGLGIIGMSPEVIGRMGQPLIANSVVFDERFQGEDGSLNTVDEAYASAPTGSDPEAWVEAHYYRVAIGIPAGRYPEVEARSTVALLVIAAGAWVAAAAVVERRRPY